MRVELVYAPGCNSYRKALAVLETVIAEERLPISIEMSQNLSYGEPVIRINGCKFGEPNHLFDGDPCFESISSHLVGIGFPCVEHLRTMLSQQWTELTVPA